MRTLKSTKTPTYQVTNNSASSALVAFRQHHHRVANILLWLVLPMAILFLSVTGFVFGLLP